MLNGYTLSGGGRGKSRGNRTTMMVMMVMTVMVMMTELATHTC